MVDQLDCPCYAEIQKLWWINWNVRAVQKCKSYAGSIAVSILCRNTKAMLDQLECPLSMLCRNTKDMVDQLDCPCCTEIQKIWWINWIVRSVQKYKCYGRSIALSNVHAMQKYNSCGGSIGMSMLCRNTKDMVDQLHCPCYAEIQKLWWINWIVHGMQKYKRYSGSIGLSVRALVAFVCLKVIS